MTGMMAQTGSLGQPLLIPLSVPGPIGGQGGVALLTLPTTNLASLPGFAATNVAGNLLKLPFAGLQGKNKTKPESASCFIIVLRTVNPSVSFPLERNQHATRLSLHSYFT